MPWLSFCNPIDKELLLATNDINLFIDGFFFVHDSYFQLMTGAHLLIWQISTFIDHLII